MVKICLEDTEWRTLLLILEKEVDRGGEIGWISHIIGIHYKINKKISEEYGINQ